MPDRNDAPRGRPLRNALFWAGVAVALLAAALLLLAEGNTTLRIAAVLALLSVVLIGLSVMLRGDVDAVRDDIREEVRAEVRADIAAAIRTTHQAFGEKVQVLQQTVDALRAQLDAAGAPAPAPAPAPDRASAYEPATASVGSRVPAQYTPSTTTTYAQPATEYAQPRYGAQPYVGSGHRASAEQRTGLFQHTETVHVTRHTVVGDQRNAESGSVYGGGRYRPEPDDHEEASTDAYRSYGSAGYSGARGQGGEYGGGSYTGGSYNGGSYSGASYGGGSGYDSGFGADYRDDDRTPEPAEESWTDQRLREYRDRGWSAGTTPSWDDSPSWPAFQTPPQVGYAPTPPALPAAGRDPAAAWGVGWADEPEPVYGRRAADPDDRWR